MIEYLLCVIVAQLIRIDANQGHEQIQAKDYIPTIFANGALIWIIVKIVLLGIAAIIGWIDSLFLDLMTG